MPIRIAVAVLVTGLIHLLLIYAAALTQTTTVEAARFPDYSYVCLMPDANVDGIRTLLLDFGSANHTTFRWAPLDPDGKAVAIQLEKNGLQLTAVNNEMVNEFYFDIRRLGDSPTYEQDARRLSDALLAILRPLPGVVTKWRAIPLNYDPGIPMSKQARPPGPPPPD